MTNEQYEGKNMLTKSGVRIVPPLHVGCPDLVKKNNLHIFLHHPIRKGHLDSLFKLGIVSSNSALKLYVRGTENANCS